MKKNIAVYALVLFASAAFAKDDDCPSAADAAEAQNPNAYKDCDYSKTGLNGALHRAFAKSKENDDNETAVKEPVNKEIAEKAPQASGKVKLVAANEFNSPQQLQTLKFALLEKVALECTKGFVVEGERYLPVSYKTTKLELIYHCL